MWRSLVAVLLLHSLTAAQAQQDRPVPPVRPDESTPKLSERARPKPASSRQYTFYDAIRRGRSEEAAIQLSVSGFVTTPQSPVAGIVPLKLELQPSEGMIFSKFRYPKTMARKVNFRPEPIAVAWMPFIRFQLKADDSAALGARVLSGKLTFQAIRMDSSLGPVEQLDVLIPITVVEHDAKVSKAEWPFPPTAFDNPDHDKLVLLLFLPILLPLMMLEWLVCGVTGRDCR